MILVAVGCVAACALSPLPVFSEVPGGEDAPPFQTAKIVYRSSRKELDATGKPIADETGREVRYLDAVHNRERVELNFISVSETDPPQQTWIFDGTTTYLVDMTKKEAASLPGRVRGGEVVWKDEVFPMEKYRLGDEEVAGKPCGVYQVPDSGTKNWYWEGVSLKSEINIPNFVHALEALAVEENLPLAEELFVLPAGITVKDTETAESEELEQLRQETPAPSFKTVKIIYKITQDLSMGDLSVHKEGIETKWVDAAGDRKRVERTWNGDSGNGEAPLFHVGERELEIQEGNNSYTIDLDLKTGLVMKAVFPARVDQIFHEKYKTGRQELVLGRACDIYETGGERCWIWNNLILKQERKTKELQASSEAMQIEENVEIPEGLFALPPKVKIQTFDERIQGFEASQRRMEDVSAQWDKTFDSVKAWGEKLNSELQIPGLDAFDYLETVLYSENWDRLMEVVAKSPALTGEQKKDKSARLGIALDEEKKRLDLEIPPEMKESMKALASSGLFKKARGESEEMLEMMFKHAHLNATVILMACERYHDRTQAYPEDLSQAADLLSGDFLKGVKSREGVQGYFFEYMRKDPQHFELWARPLRSDGKTLFSDETGTFRLGGKDGPVYEEEKKPGGAETSP